MADNVLTDKMRAALRISSTNAKITEEIEDCICACMADLANDGIKVFDEADPLIIRAVTLYCKSEFGYNEKAEQFRRSYDTLKMRLALSKKYKGDGNVIQKMDSIMRLILSQEYKDSMSKTDTEGAESRV